MSSILRSLKPLVLPLCALFLSTPALAQENSGLKDLEAGLQKPQNVARNAPQVLIWRRDPNFILRLTEITLSKTASLPLRQKAIRLLGACGERDQTAKTLLVLSQQSQFPKALQDSARDASQRIRNRRRARAFLKLGQSQRTPPKNTLAEIQTLARDPLESRSTPVLRLRALKVLQAQKPFSSTIFIELVQNEEDAPAARREALSALFRHKPSAISKVIPALLTSTETSLYQSSLQFISQFTTRSIQLVHKRLRLSSSLQERLRACEILGSAHWLPSVRDFNKIRQNASEASTIRLEALRALVQLGKINRSKAATEILEAMRLVPEKQRWRAIRALETLPITTIVNAVQPLFNNATQEERLRAIQLTNALNLIELAAPLRRLAKNKEEQDLNRILAITTLGRQQLPQNAKTLLEILRSDTSSWIQSHAARALQDPLYKSDVIRETLEKLLSRSDTHLRRLAIETLTVHGNARSAEKLSAILLRPKVSVETQLTVLRSLRKLPPPAKVEFLTQVETVSVSVAQELVLLIDHYQEKNSVTVALNLLDHRDPSIRSQAWRLLLNWFPPKTMKVPEGAIPFRYNPNDPPTTRRRAALRWRSWWQANKNKVPITKKNS